MSYSCRANFLIALTSQDPACEADDDQEISGASYCDDDEDFTAYRRLTGSGHRRLTTARAQSCDGLPDQISWPNQEIFDITGCCDTDNWFFFLMMVLFWYRPAPTNLEMIVYMCYWVIAVGWGYGVVVMIREEDERESAIEEADFFKDSDGVFDDKEERAVETETSGPLSPGSVDPGKRVYVVG